MKDIQVIRQQNKQSLETVILTSASGIGAAVTLLATYVTYKVYSPESFVAFYQILLLTEIFRTIVGLKLDQTVFREKNKLRRAQLVLRIAVICTLPLLLIGIGSLILGWGDFIFWATFLAFISLVIEMGANLLVLFSRIKIVVAIRISRPIMVFGLQFFFASVFPSIGLELGFLLGGFLTALICLAVTGLWRLPKVRRREMQLLFVRNRLFLINYLPASALMMIAKAAPFYMIQGILPIDISSLFAVVLRYVDGLGGLIVSNVSLTYLKYRDLNEFNNGSPFSFGISMMFFACTLCLGLALAMPSYSVISIAAGGSVFYISRIAILPYTSKSLFEKREYLMALDALIICTMLLALFGLQIMEQINLNQRPEVLFGVYVISLMFFPIEALLSAKMTQTK